MRWSKLVDGKGNEENRAGHTLEVTDTITLAYGGTKSPTNLVMQLKDESNNFAHVYTFNLPEDGYRQRHVSFMLPGRLVVFGGVDIKTDLIVNTLISLNLNDFKWREEKLVKVKKIPNLVDFGHCVVSSEPKIGAKVGSKKNFEELGEMFKTKLYLFGGQDSKERMSNNLYAIKYKNGVFSWHCVEAKDEGPKERINCSLSYYERNRSLVLFGGETSVEPYCLNDFWFFYLDFRKWVRIEVNLKISPRANHVATVWEEKLIVFSGLSENIFCSSDFLIVNLETKEEVQENDSEIIVIEKKDTNKNIVSKKIAFDSYY